MVELQHLPRLFLVDPNVLWGCCQWAFVISYCSVLFDKLYNILIVCLHHSGVLYSNQVYYQ